MHEAQQDAEESGATGFSGIFSVLVFLGLVYLISKIWSSKNKNSSNASNSTYDAGIDDDIHWKIEEEKQEKAEIEELDRLKDIEDLNYYFNSYDYSSIKKESSKETDDVPQKPKYHPSTGDVFLTKLYANKRKNIIQLVLSRTSCKV